MNHFYYEATQQSSHDSAESCPSTPLEVNVESRSETGSPSPVLRLIRIGGAVIAGMAFLLLLANNGGTVGRLTGFSNIKQLAETTDTDFQISVEVTSPGYDAVAESLSMLPWDAIAEPYREQYISVSEFVVDGETLVVEDSSYDVAWSIDGTTYSGTEVSFQIDATGVYDCTVSITPKTQRRRLGSKSKDSDNKSSKKSKKSEKSSDKRFAAYHESKAKKTSAKTTTASTDSTDASDANGTNGPSVLLTPINGNDEEEEEDTTEDVSNEPVIIVIDRTSAKARTATSSISGSTSVPSDISTGTTMSPANGAVEAGASYTLSFTLAVKYVRREVRALTDDDREAIMNAIYMMYTVDEVPGKALYGEKFNTAEYYVYKHLNGAGTTDCDHWHDGAGIVTHHMAFTLEVEQTLQTIDPSLAMPYWEYGMDPYMYTNWWESPLFDADWFGEANPANDEHIISDGGMWQGISMPDGDDYADWSIAETGSLNPFVNGYSMMRSPWNNNPSPLIGRHNQTYGMSQYDTMPLCSTLQSCFKSTSLAYINDCLNGATHGPVHILIGGAWGEGSLFDDEDIEFCQMPDKLLFFKVLWRMGYTRCPETCSLGEPCRCSVPQEYIDTYGAETLLTNTNVIYALASDLTDADDDLYLKVLRAVEDPGIAGEMFSSAAAFDPTFWPLHGAAERLVDLKRIYVAQGDITNFDETWAYVTYNKASGAAYLNGVCDWSKVAGSGDLTLPTCTIDVTCDGHNENDVLEFAGFLNQDDDYTNAEFYDFMHPWSDDLPYTYDTFDYDYCKDEVSPEPSPPQPSFSRLLPLLTSLHLFLTPFSAGLRVQRH